jgi:hypothetical protein
MVKYEIYTADEVCFGRLEIFRDKKTNQNIKVFYLNSQPRYDLTEKEFEKICVSVGYGKLQDLKFKQS